MYKKLWKELICPFLLCYVKILYQLHYLTMVNCILWFQWLHYLPWVIWLNSWSKYGTHCCTSMISTLTLNCVVTMVTDLKVFMAPHCLVQVFHTSSEVWTLPFWNIWSYRIKEYGIAIKFNDMISLLNFMKIYQLVQKLLVGDSHTAWWSLKPYFF
jgi:hypothetical protein